MYLRLQPYRQHSLRSKRCTKLSPKFYGPFQILQKLGSVAYKLSFLMIVYFTLCSMCLASSPSLAFMLTLFPLFHQWILRVHSSLNRLLLFSREQSHSGIGKLLKFWYNGRVSLKTNPLGNPSISCNSNTLTLWARCFKRGRY